MISRPHALELESIWRAHSNTSFLLFHYNFGDPYDMVVASCFVVGYLYVSACVVIVSMRFLVVVVLGVCVFVNISLCLNCGSRTVWNNMKGRWYGWKAWSSTRLWIRAFRAYPLIEIRQTAPCRAIRGNSISINSILPPS